MQPPRKLFLFLSVTVFSCATKEQKQTGTPAASSGTIQPPTQQTSLRITDTLTLDRKAAVFYQPDSLQMDKRMKEVGEEAFRAGADDYIYAINTSVAYLEEQGLSVLDAKNKNYLQFVSADGPVQVIRLDTLEELWGLYLFEPGKKPRAADITMIEEEYKNYYTTPR